MLGAWRFLATAKDLMTGGALQEVALILAVANQATVLTFSLWATIADLEGSSYLILLHPFGCTVKDQAQISGRKEFLVSLFCDLGHFFRRDERQEFKEFALGNAPSFGTIRFCIIRGKCRFENDKRNFPHAQFGQVYRLAVRAEQERGAARMLDERTLGAYRAGSANFSECQMFRRANRDLLFVTL